MQTIRMIYAKIQSMLEIGYNATTWDKQKKKIKAKT